MVSSSSACMLSCAASERVEISLVSLSWWDATHCIFGLVGNLWRSESREDRRSKSECMTMVFIAPGCGYASICVIFVFVLSLSVCMWILFLIFCGSGLSWMLYSSIGDIGRQIGGPP